MRAKYIRVRARSANAGSGTVGWSLGPGPACFLIGEVMVVLSWHFERSESMRCGTRPHHHAGRLGGLRNRPEQTGGVL